MTPNDPNAPLKDAALAYVNRVRQALGQPLLSELPKGSLSHANECPIARGIEGSVVRCSTIRTNTMLTPKVGTHKDLAERLGSIETMEGLDTHLKHPEAVIRFIRAFDIGKMPELIETPELIEA